MASRLKPQDDDSSNDRTLTVRQASEKDLQPLVGMINSAYREEQTVSWKSEAELLAGVRTDLEALKELIASPKKALLILNLSDRDQKDVMVGCVLLENKDTFSYLGMLTIHPAFQNLGLAKKLLAYSEQFILQHWRLNKILMTVIGQRQELIQYYQRFGYQLTGRQEPFPYGEERFGEPKRQDLYFEVLEKKLPTNH